MKSPSKEIMEQMQEAHQRQFAVGNESLQAQAQVKALRLKLTRWLFFCTWAKTWLVFGSLWCWSVYQSGLSWSGPEFMFIAWFVIGVANILKWTFEIKSLEKRAST